MNTQTSIKLPATSPFAFVVCDGGSWDISETRAQRLQAEGLTAYFPLQHIMPYADPVGVPGIWLESTADIGSGIQNIFHEEGFITVRQTNESNDCLIAFLGPHQSNHCPPYEPEIQDWAEKWYDLAVNRPTPDTHFIFGELVARPDGFYAYLFNTRGSDISLWKPRAEAFCKAMGSSQWEWKPMTLITP